MNKEELAALLHGRQYGKEMTKDEEAQAKAAGLIVIFGYSDDNVEMRGALNDEMGMCGGGNLLITSEGSLFPMFENIEFSDEKEAEEYFRKKALKKSCIKCIWSPTDEEISWRYETDLPSTTFEIMEDGEKYCRGIVISTAHL